MSLVFIGFLVLAVMYFQAPVLVVLIAGGFSMFAIGVGLFQSETNTLLRAARGEFSVAPPHEIDGSRYLRWMGGTFAVAVVATIMASIGYVLMASVLFLGFMVVRIYMSHRPKVEPAGSSQADTGQAERAGPGRARWGAFRMVGSMLLVTAWLLLATYGMVSRESTSLILAAVVGAVVGVFLMHWQTAAVAREFGIPEK